MKKISTATGTSSAEPLKTVLYVEDEDSNWEVTLLRLGQRYKLLRAQDAKSACEVLRSNSDLYAILMDIQLHGSDLDGIQMTRLLRGTLPAEEMPAYGHGVRAPETPILFVTAYGSRYTEADLIAAGGDLMVTKPVDFLKLNLALANVSARRASNMLPAAKS